MNVHLVGVFAGSIGYDQEYDIKPGMGIPRSRRTNVSSTRAPAGKRLRPWARGVHEHHPDRGPLEEQ